MAWIYLAESAESLKPWHPGCGQLPTVKETWELSASYFHECIEEKLSKPQFGMTLELFEVQCSRRLTSSPEASLVRISQLRDFKKAWVARGQDFSTKFADLQKKQRRQFFSLRMFKASQDLFKPSEMKLNQWAMSVEMGLSQPVISARAIKDKDGFFVPAPTASSCGHNQGGGSGRQGKIRYSLESLWKMGMIPTPTVSQKTYDRQKNGKISPSVLKYWEWTFGTMLPASFVEILMGYSIDATVSELWATAWSRSKSKRHFKSLPELEVSA